MNNRNENNNDDDPPGGLAVSISPHLKNLSVKSSAIKNEFYPSPRELNYSNNSFIDPLLEDVFEKTKGLVHKYPGRVLILMTMRCASYCRFCTRRRSVSDFAKGLITKKDVDNMVVYLASDPTIGEAIFSGGDPLMVPDLLIYAFKRISALQHIKVLRIHTRVPVSNPSLVDKRIYRLIAQSAKPVFVSIHFEHPDEITPATIRVITKLRQSGAQLLSQSVFLKGVNDSYETLKTLFTNLTYLGIRPYYIYRCDPVRGAEHFVVPYNKEIQIMTKLRKNLSGIAYPTYVIDSPDGAGKIPVPLDFWKFEHPEFNDFNGKKINVV